MVERLNRLVLLLALFGVAVTSLAADTARPLPPMNLAIDGETTGALRWQLAEGEFVPAKMPMQVVYPRPDSETNDWARHRRAYPGLEYRIPVAVQGGAFPFRYEIVRGPRGMEIGSSHWDRDYGVLSWTPQEQGGPHAVQVRVTDQEGAIVYATFAVTSTTEGFVFLDPAGPASGDGSISAPLRTFADIHRDSTSDSTFGGKILYLRGGVHDLSGPSETNNNFRIDGASKPLVWLGYPGESPVVNAANSQVVMIGADGGRDVFMQGFRISNSRADVNDSRFFFFGAAAGERVTFFEVEFDNLRRGLSGNDNPGAIVMFRGAEHRQYLTVISCSIDEYAAPLVGSIYATRFAVIESNRLGASSRDVVNQGIYPKAANDLWSIRRNVSVDQVFHEGAIQNGMGSTGYGPQRVEIAYNLVRSPATSSGRHSVRVNWSNNAVGENWVWVYRNTIIGPIAGLDGEYTAVFENNLVISDLSPVLPEDGANRVVEKRGNVMRRLSELGQLLGDSYELYGSSRGELFGTHGHELGK